MQLEYWYLYILHERCENTIWYCIGADMLCDWFACLEQQGKTNVKLLPTFFRLLESDKEYPDLI